MLSFLQPVAAQFAAAHTLHFTCSSISKNANHPFWTKQAYHLIKWWLTDEYKDIFWHCKTLDTAATDQEPWYSLILHFFAFGIFCLKHKKPLNNWDWFFIWTFFGTPFEYKTSSAQFLSGSVFKGVLQWQLGFRVKPSKFKLIFFKPSSLATIVLTCFCSQPQKDHCSSLFFKTK